jgi:hypothetical protein
MLSEAQNYAANAFSAVICERILPATLLILNVKHDAIAFIENEKGG